MIIKARLNHLQISPRKVRIVAKMIKNMNTKKAEQQLLYMNKKSAQPLLKLLKSALANAQHNFNIQETSDFYVKNVRVDQGATLKRWRPRAFGRAYTVRKRSSRILLEIEIKDDKIIKKSKEEISQKKTGSATTKPSSLKKNDDEKTAKEKEPKTSFFNKDSFSKKERLKNTKRRFFQRKSF
ncbi:50S ribosomal protein L22 [bacterium]|nr:MAG: 50S ribosomal protein L22 [bacterium]